MIRLGSGQSTNLIKHFAICIVIVTNEICKRFNHTKHESDLWNNAVLSKGFARISQQSNLEGKIKENFKSESERAKLRAPYR